jgi:hypothetical protein
MPKNVYMPDVKPRRGGVAFHVSWNRIEQCLRGNDPKAHTNAVIGSDESCEFVINEYGIEVYVDKE